MTLPREKNRYQKPIIFLSTARCLYKKISVVTVIFRLLFIREIPKFFCREQRNREVGGDGRLRGRRAVVGILALVDYIVFEIGGIGGGRVDGGKRVRCCLHLPACNFNVTLRGEKIQ